MTGNQKSEGRGKRDGAKQTGIMAHSMDCKKSTDSPNMGQTDSIIKALALD